MDKPKLFVEIDGRTIYEHQVDVLGQYFDELTVVLGHGFVDADEETISDRLDVDDVAVDHVVLDDWKSVENAASLRAAIEARQSRDPPVDDLLVVCGDVVFADRALSEVVERFENDYRPSGYNAVGCFPGVQDEMTAVRFDDSGEITEYGKITGHQEIGVFVLYEQYVADARRTLADNRTEWFPVVFEDYPSKRVVVPEWTQHEINTPEHLAEARDGLPFVGETVPSGAR